MDIDGVAFHYEVAGNGFPLLLLHGFTGSAVSWRPFADAWGGFRTISVDLIGHGETDSPPEETRYTMERCTSDLTTLLDRLGVGRVAVLGYSMGGRVALHLSLAAPARVAALALVSAGTGVEDTNERRVRVEMDRALADDIERDGTEAFVDRWEQLSMWASQARLPGATRAALRAQRLCNSPIGLANSLRGMGAGAQEPVLDRVHELHIPVLLLVGAEDAKYRAIARSIQARLDHASLRVVEDAGHAIHFEQPAAFAPLVKEFLTSCLSSILQQA